MRRTRLPPAPVTYLEKHHAYTSPPQPENGGLPTIIVTPAEANQVQDFEIHFFSPKAVQFPPTPPPQGIIPRVRSLFRRPPPPIPMPVFAEKADFFDTEDITEANAKSDGDASAPLITTTPTPAPTTSPARRSRAIRNGGYVALPQSDDDEEVGTGLIHGVPTITEQTWTAITAEQMHQMQTNPMMLESGSGIWTARFNRRTRTMLFLCVPVALVAFHLVTHHLGLIPGAHMWSEPSETPLGGPTL